MAQDLSYKLALTNANNSSQLMHDCEMVWVPFEPMDHENFFDKLPAQKVIPYLF